MRRLTLLTCFAVVMTATPAFADPSPATLTVDASPAWVVLGEAVTVSGTVTDPADTAGLSIDVARSPDGVTFTPIADSPTATDGSGAFSISDTPPDPGTYTYRASWDGDGATYGPGEATSGSVSALPTASLTIDPETTAAFVGQAVPVSGTITTSADTAGASVVISRSSDGVTFSPVANSPVTADGGGDFTLSDTPPGVGTYTYEATWDGGGIAGPATADSASQLSVTRWDADLSIAASADTITYGSTVKISGAWSAASGIAPTDTTVTITRVKTGGGTTTPTVALDGSGVYKLIDTPPSAGTYTYTASWAGDATHAPASSGDVEVMVGKRSTALTLRLTRQRIEYGGITRLIARLKRGDAGSKVWFEERVDGGWQTIDAVAVDADGVAKLAVSPDGRRTYRAVFDATSNLRASASEPATVGVRPIMVSKMIGKFHLADGYAVYACCTAYFYVKLKPLHPHAHWKATVQYYGKGRWRSLGSSTYTFEKDGDSAIFLSAPTGYRYRVRARFDGDADHLAVTGRWSYFRLMH